MLFRRSSLVLLSLVLLMAAFSRATPTPASAVAITTITVASGAGVTPPTGGTVLDPNTQVSLDGGGTWTQAYAADNAGLWPAPLPGSNWDTPSANREQGYGEPQTIRYRTSFVLPGGFTLPSLSGLMASDDKSGEVLLNGTSLATYDTSFGYDSTPKAYSTSIASLFLAGTNTLEFVVVNWGGASGVDFSAAVSYAAPSGPPPLPTSKDQCKDGGWQTFGVFKNQGDCVSFVATGGKNPPAH